MNIDSLTIGEVKQLSSLLNTNSAVSSDLYQDFIGKYVICRTRNEGVNAGRVVRLDETGVVLENSRRLYYHIPLNKKVSWYEGVAQSGLSEKSKVGAAVTKIIVEDYSLTLCTKTAEKSISKAKDNEQS